MADRYPVNPPDWFHVMEPPPAQCPKARWHACERCQARMQREGLCDEYELQSWFVGRVGAFLAAQGGRMIGWDEILEGGLPPGATVMSWRVRARLGFFMTLALSPRTMKGGLLPGAGRVLAGACQIWLFA